MYGVYLVLAFARIVQAYTEYLLDLLLCCSSLIQIVKHYDILLIQEIKDIELTTMDTLLDAVNTDIGFVCSLLLCHSLTLSNLRFLRILLLHKHYTALRSRSLMLNNTRLRMLRKTTE